MNLNEHLVAKDSDISLKRRMNTYIIFYKQMNADVIPYLPREKSHIVQSNMAICQCSFINWSKINQLMQVYYSFFIQIWVFISVLI